MFRLDSRKALVTGAASGIGEAIAHALSRAGAAVVVADIDADNGERVAQACGAQAAGGRFISLNVADEMNCERVADEIGPIDILVNNAGIGHVGTIEQTAACDLDRLYGVNVRGMFNVTKAFIGSMLARRTGTIVNMASIGGVLGIADRLAYCTTKFAARGLSECLQLDLAPAGIGVSVLCPGAVNTNIHEAVLTRPKHLSNTGYYGADPVVMRGLKEVIAPGYDPVELGEIVVRAVQANQLYVIPYAEFREPLQQRLDLALAVIPDPKDDPGMAGREAAMTRRRAERAAEAERANR